MAATASTGHPAAPGYPTTTANHDGYPANQSTVYNTAAPPPTAAYAAPAGYTTAPPAGYPVQHRATSAAPRRGASVRKSSASAVHKSGAVHYPTPGYPASLELTHPYLTKVTRVHFYKMYLEITIDMQTFRYVKTLSVILSESKGSAYFMNCLS